MGTRNISQKVLGQLPTYFAKRPQHEVHYKDEFDSEDDDDSYDKDQLDDLEHR